MQQKEKSFKAFAQDFKKKTWYAGKTELYWKYYVHSTIDSWAWFKLELFIYISTVSPTCPQAYQPILISCFYCALFLRLASLHQQLLTHWPLLVCPLDGRRGRMPREELITSTITTAAQRGPGQLCRYSRSEGWLDFYAWDWSFLGPCHGLGPWAGPLPFSVFVSVQFPILSSFTVYPSLLWHFVWHTALVTSFSNRGMELQLALFPPFSHFCPVFPLGSPCLCLQMRRLPSWGRDCFTGLYVLMLKSLLFEIHFCSAILYLFICCRHRLVFPFSYSHLFLFLRRVENADKC